VIARLALRVLLVVALLLQNSIGGVSLAAQLQSGHCHQGSELAGKTGEKCPCCPAGDDATACVHLCAPLVGLAVHVLAAAPRAEASAPLNLFVVVASFDVDPPTRPPIA
jgi:hypothetical protein